MGIRSNFCDCAASSKNGLREQRKPLRSGLTFCHFAARFNKVSFQPSRESFLRGHDRDRLQKTHSRAVCGNQKSSKQTVWLSCCHVPGPFCAENHMEWKPEKDFSDKMTLDTCTRKSSRQMKKTVLKPAWKISSPEKKIPGLGISFSGLGFFRPSPGFSHTTSRKKQNSLWFFAQKTRFVQKNRVIFLYFEAKRQKSGTENRSKNDTLPDFSPVR